MATDTMIGSGVAFCICLLMGAIMVPVFIGKNKDDKQEHNDQFATANAEITNITRGDHTCYRERNCNKCISGGGYPACGIMITQKQTGTCQSSNPLCCKESCYYCSVLDDDIGETCKFCGNKGTFCNDDCYCSEKTANPMCTVIQGTCYTPEISVSFITDDGTSIDTSTKKECDIGQVQCADNFIIGKLEGEYITIHYEKNCPSTIYLDGNTPSHKMKKGVKAGIIFGVIFLVVAFIALVFLIIELKESGAELPDCDCCSSSGSSSGGGGGFCCCSDDEPKTITDTNKASTHDTTSVTEQPPKYSVGSGISGNDYVNNHTPQEVQNGIYTPYQNTPQSGLYPPVQNTTQSGLYPPVQTNTHQNDGGDFPQQQYPYYGNVVRESSA